MVDRLFGWWYVLAAPPAVPDDTPLREREFVRRGRFTSIILLAELIYHLFNLGAFLASGLARIIMVPVFAISITILLFLIAIALNRLRHVYAASVVTLLVVEISMCLSIASSGLVPGGLGSNILSTFSILLQPDLIAISLFPVALALPLGLFNCLFCIATLAFLPKAPGLQQILASEGVWTYANIISVQLIVLLVSWVWVSSASQEMARANRAEEINKLSQALAVQQQNALEEKQQLEESIQQVIAVHARVANGDFSARVPLNQQNMLWPLAGSLNNLLARLQRWREGAMQQSRTETAIQQTLQEIQKAKRQGIPIHIRPTGTLLDHLIAEFVDAKSLSHSSRRETRENLTSS